MLSVHGHAVGQGGWRRRGFQMIKLLLKLCRAELRSKLSPAVKSQKVSEFAPGLTPGRIRASEKILVPP